MPQTQPTTIYEDNSACISYSKNNTCHARTKHIDLRAYDLRDQVREGKITLIHVDTKQQLADMMTKTQLKNTFMMNRDKVFSNNHTPLISITKRVTAKNCHCISCLVTNVKPVCEKSVYFDPILMFDKDW